MWGWIRSNAEALEASAAIMTAIVALVALVGVKLQIDENDRLQREQGARETYREFLKITMEQPDLAAQSWCSIRDPLIATSYAHYVEYALYTAEQVIRSDPEWRDPVVAMLTDHSAYLCHEVKPSQYSETIRGLVEQVIDSNCDPVEPCR